MNTRLPISHTPWRSEADHKRFIDDMIYFGRAWAREKDGRREHVPIESVFDEPEPPK